ncbi:MAG TPA: NADH-quinone oxidoreductase subunit L, partial [Fimbriimonadaceae bacterium]|nr:NADH-quinone oxidoreductase subunit L [Fimbriimonadaceae bacterium]
MVNEQLIWVVLAMPVLGFLVQAFLGGYIIRKEGPEQGRRFMGGLAVLPIAIAFAVGVLITVQLAGLPPEQRFLHTELFSWIQIGSLNIPFEFVIDPLSMTMVLIVTGVGGLIHLYATGYMHEEKDYPRFFTYLNLFIAAMLILVLGNNLVMMFVGWEGVGLCSYLLIGFWYKDLANAKAANKAFIVNRIGDWGFTLGIFLLAVMIESQRGLAQNVDGRVLSYDVLLKWLPFTLHAHPALATTAALLLFVGACGKSAQFPLYLWLPDAMAGPTPVSALIHAATMVTSGVVLLNRMHVVFENSPVASAIVACIGAFTALFAALVAFGQTDIKKVLAYSTVSQLGYMFVACGAGAYWVGIFHVTTHAFFKALLFLGSGAVIMAMAHEQDMRNYGKLAKYLPITCWTMFTAYIAISAFAIPGVGGFSGYYSKEPIIGAALGNRFASIQNLNLGVVA